MECQCRLKHVERKAGTYNVEDGNRRVTGLSGAFDVGGGHRMLDICHCRGVDEVVRHLGWCGRLRLLL